MSKRSKIKWNDNDLKNIEKTVRNFNKKLDRVAKKNPSIKDYLPSRASVKDFKSKIETRADLNRELNSLKRFSKRGSEKIKTSPTGLTLTEYEIKETQNKVRIVNIKRANERKKLDIDVTKGNMGQIENNNLKPKLFSTNKTPKEWDKFVESLEKELNSNFKLKQLEIYKQRYLDAVNDFLGEAGKELYKLAEKIDVKDFFNFSMDDPILSISFTSDPLDADVIAEKAIEHWKKAILNE